MAESQLGIDDCSGSLGLSRVQPTSGSCSGHRCGHLSARSACSTAPSSALRQARPWAARPASMSPVPASFRCPCCDRIMSDPVLASDGMTFERTCIEAWLQTGTALSPVSGKPLESKTLFPDTALREAVKDYMKLRDRVGQRHSQRCQYLASTQLKFSGTVAGKERQCIALTEILGAKDRGGGTDAAAALGSARSRRAARGGAKEEVGAGLEAPPLLQNPDKAEEQAAHPFSSGAAPRRPDRALTSSKEHLKRMRAQQRQEMAGSGLWWTQMCR